MTAQGTAPGLIESFRDLLAALRADARFDGCDLVRPGDDSVEIHRADVAALLAMPSVWRSNGSHLERRLKRVESPMVLICLGTAEELGQAAGLRGRVTYSCAALPTTPDCLVASLSCTLDLFARKHRVELQGQLAERYRFELKELISIGTALSSERDINRLLGLILEKSRYVTGADAGSIYVLVPHPTKPGQQALRFEVAQNESIEVNFKTSTMEVSRRSIVGTAVLQREVINIPDLYDLDHCNPLGVEHDRSFDRQTGYQTRSVLAVPLINQRDLVIGVLQLINKKKTPGLQLKRPEDFEEVMPFDQRSVELCRTLATQAGISLENALLYAELRSVFEGFVEASVQAIESRDPTTSGHSRRVADLTVGLAEAADRETQGPLASVRFSADELREIEYAGLLHDFGKIGVPEPVLLKACKLYEWEQAILLSRFDYIRQWQRAENLRQKLDLCRRTTSPAELDALDASLEEQERYLDYCVEVVTQANQPTVLDNAVSEVLKDIGQKTYVDARGERQPWLTERELRSLGIRRGSLSEEERLQIESHVVHTFKFLCTIPWGRGFRNLPRIAADHHEKLDGSGYPGRKQGDDIPLQARMMTISDIFDALTAADRPYKRAVPCERALDILSDDVQKGRLDPELFRLFVEAGVYRRVLKS